MFNCIISNKNYNISCSANVYFNNELHWDGYNTRIQSFYFQLVVNYNIL